jgi:hypothetical protein
MPPGDKLANRPGGAASKFAVSAPHGSRNQRCSLVWRNLQRERNRCRSIGQGCSSTDALTGSQLFDRHLNAQLARVLRTLGFARDYVRAEGPHLFDADGNRYLDLLSGFGVFALGRNHPTVTGAREQVLRGRLAGLVQLDRPGCAAPTARC